MPLYIISGHHLRQILMLVFLALWTSSLAVMSHFFLCYNNLIDVCLSSFVCWILLSLNCCCFLCVVMAGSAPEGTQFDARQFDQKLNEV